MDETYHQNLKLIAIRKGDSLNRYCKRLYLTTWIKTVPCYNSVSGIYRANTPQKKFSRKRYAKSTPTHQKYIENAIPYKNPLAGLILRMFNLPTGTILINVWIKVGRLRLYLHQPSLLSLHQTGSDSTQPLPDHHNHHRNQRVDMTLALFPCISERNINCFVFAC